jgi:arylformamidase
MARVYDISLLISPHVPAWPGDRFVLHKVEEIAKGDVCNKSILEIGSHIATHIDAPYHFERDGMSIDQMPLDAFLGPARVVSFPEAEKIGLGELQTVSLSGVERILFKTRNSSLWEEGSFREDYVYLTPEACCVLADSGVRLVGVDYLSIEEYGVQDFEGHHILLGKGIPLLEGLNLSEVEPGDYELVALPLKIAGGDGSPARAILRELAASQ